MQSNPIPGKTKEINVVSSLKVIETEYKVKNVIFEDEIVKRPVFVEEKISIPVGLNETVETIAEMLYDKIFEKIALSFDKRLEQSISSRLAEVVAPKIIFKEELNIVKKDVEVLNPILKDIPVNNAIVTDVQVSNAIVQDYPVINAVIHDVEVINAIMKDKIIINPIYTDVPIQRPKFIDKEIVVIHPKYIDMKGNPEPQ